MNGLVREAGQVLYGWVGFVGWSVHLNDLQQGILSYIEQRNFVDVVKLVYTPGLGSGRKSR